MPDSVEWAYTASRSARFLVHVGYGTLASIGVVLLVLVSLLVLSAFESGDESAVVVLFGAAITHRVLFALLDDRLVDAGPDLPGIDFTPRLRWVVASGVVVAVALAGLASVSPTLAAVGFVAGVLSLALGSLVSTSGRLDPDELTVTLDHQANPRSLRGLRRVRRLTLGPLTYHWLSYERGAPTSSRLVVLPTSTVDRARPVFEAARAAEFEPKRTPSRAERAVALVFGAGLLALGPVLFFVASDQSRAAGVALYTTLSFGLFGVVFVWYGLVS